MKKAGYGFYDASLDQIRERLILLRKIAQVSGDINLSSIEEHTGTIKDRSKKILDRMLEQERNLIPAEKDWDAFLKAYPSNAKKILNDQSASLGQKIQRALDVEPRALYPKLSGDAQFAKLAYDVVVPELAKASREALSSVKGVDGQVQSRPNPTAPGVKAFKSAFKKSQKKGVSFIDLGDLVGHRVVCPNIKALAEATAQIQKKLKVAEKDNKYLDNTAYLAVHYDIQTSNKISCEVQVKTTQNLVEAAISHDILHKPENALVALTDSDREMVARVVDISIQMSLEDMEEYLADLQQRA